MYGVVLVRVEGFSRGWGGMLLKVGWGELPGAHSVVEVVVWGRDESKKCKINRVKY